MRYSVREARSSVMGSMIRVGSGSSDEVKDRYFIDHKGNSRERTDGDGQQNMSDHFYTFI